MLSHFLTHCTLLFISWAEKAERTRKSPLDTWGKLEWYVIKCYPLKEWYHLCLLRCYTPSAKHRPAGWSQVTFVTHKSSDHHFTPYQISRMASFGRWESWDWEKLKDFPRITQELHRRARTKTLEFYIPPCKSLCPAGCFQVYLKFIWSTYHCLMDHHIS